MRNATPSSALIPAPIATPRFDDDEDDEVLKEDELDGDANLAAVVVAVVVAVAMTVAVTVVLTVFVMLGDVEPDVRLKITNPASTKNGSLLPLVATQHDWLPMIPWSQQNLIVFGSVGLTRCILTDPLSFTKISMSAS